MRFAALLGTPSVTLLALIADVVARRFFHRALFTPRERDVMLAFSAALAVVLYSSALGYLPIDIYRAGFSPWAPVALAAIAIAAAPRSLAIACTALAALVAYDVPLFASVNLFDYVVDPIVGIVAVGWAVVAGARRLLRA